mmetsp:Transcript_74323/g.240375  ORF Transcript_74323/g.240375 Transcript_74323/m.240375 type:complete len:184 (+) Transcript_74323:65-616(+)
MATNGATFADSLTRIVAESRGKQRQRERAGERWRAHEGRLLDTAVEFFKQRCTRAAEQQLCEATVSFEVLTREVPGFPTRVVKDSTYLVDSWGETSAEAWWYACRGTSAAWSPGSPVLFAELLEGMMPRFLEKVSKLGFSGSGREAGTWKVMACWGPPKGQDDPSAKRRRLEGDEKPVAAAGS